MTDNKYTMPYTLKERDEALKNYRYVFGMNYATHTDGTLNARYAGFNKVKEVNRELNKKNSLYEYIKECQPVKAYIDYDHRTETQYKLFESKIKDSDKELKITILIKLVDIFISALKELTQDKTINTNNILITDGSRLIDTKTETYYKVSYHLTTYNIKHAFKNAQQVKLNLLPLLEKYDTQDQHIYNGIDHKVYGKTQKMRTIYAKKYINDHEILNPLEITKGKVKGIRHLKIDPINYLVSHISSDYNIIDIQHEEKTQENKQEKKTKNKYNDIDKPIYNNTLEDYILKLLHVHIPTATPTATTHKNNMTFYNYTYDPLNKCLYGNEHDRPTRQTSIIYTYEKEGAIYAGCHGSKCKTNEKVLIGYTLEQSPLLKNAIQINNKYIYDSEDFKAGATTFINDTNKRALCIKSGYGTGKTYLMNKIIPMIGKKLKRDNKLRILLISTRRSYARAMSNSSLKSLNIINYLDLDNKTNFNNVSRLCVSLESLYKAYPEEGGKWYDIVILDEAESISRHLLSATITQDHYVNYEKLRHFISNSDKVFMLDAELNKPALELLSMFNEDQLIKVNNNYRKLTQEYILTNNEAKFKKDIIERLRVGERSYIVSLSKETSIIYKDYLINEAGIHADRIKLINSLTDEEDIIKLGNVNDFFKCYDVIITTSTTGAGVDFNLEHFNNIYGILQAGKTPPAEFLQIINRVRIYTNSTILIYTGQVNINRLEEAFIHNFKYVSKVSNDIKKQLLIKKINHVTIDENGDKINNVTIEEQKNPDKISFNNLVIYNEMTQRYNNSNFNYALVLKIMIEQQGHIFKLDHTDEKQTKPGSITPTLLAEVKVDKSEIKELAETKNKTQQQKLKTLKLQEAKRYNINIDKVNELSEDFFKSIKNGSHIINNIINYHITDTYANNKTNDNILYATLTDHKNESMNELYKQIIDKLDYKYSTTQHISDDIYMNLINTLELSDAQKATIKSKGSLKTNDTVINAVLKRYGFSLKRKLLSRTREGVRTYDGYTLTPDTNIYALLKVKLLTTLNDTNYSTELIQLLNNNEYDNYLPYTRQLKIV